MSLKEQITDDMKTAMKAGEKSRLGVIRMLLAEIKQREVDTREVQDDASVLAILDKMAKQRRESIKQFRDGGRDDLADKEQDELQILATYLPEPLGETELEALIDDAIRDTGANSMRDMGKVMGKIKAAAQGRADMGAISAKIKARLAG